jgi:hypothetical protein
MCLGVVCEDVWIEYLGAWVGADEGCLFLYQSSCGRMGMVRDSGFVCAAILAQCSVSTIA